jgi:hypothetical protein
MPNGIPDLDPQILNEVLALGGLSEEEARLAERMTGAKALEATPFAEGIRVGGTYVAANPLQHAVVAMQRAKGMQEQAGARKRMEEIQRERAAGRRAMLGMMPGSQADLYGLATAPTEESARAMSGDIAADLARRRQLGAVGMMSGDPLAGKLGAGLIGEAERGTEALGQAGQSRLKMAFAAENAAASRKMQEMQSREMASYRNAQLRLNQQRLDIARQRAQAESKRYGLGGDNAGEDTDVKMKARAIMEGRQPPDMKGLYRMALPVAAELERHGFDLAKAQMQWDAQKRLVSSLNGPQQTRLSQATRMVEHSINKVEELYKRWEKAGIASQFPTINRADLAVAMSAGGERGAAATALNTLINDLILEQATVLMGGNAPTDQAIKHAEANLNASWGGRTFRDALDLVKYNTNIRMTVMRESTPNIGPGYEGQENPYSRVPAEIPEGTPGTGMIPEKNATHRFNPATGKIEAI